MEQKYDWGDQQEFNKEIELNCASNQNLIIRKRKFQVSGIFQLDRIVKGKVLKWWNDEVGRRRV